MKKDILNLITFCILTENRNGVLDKSPDYVEEKLQRYFNGENNEWMWGLDSQNWDKLREYASKWLKRDIDEEKRKWEEEIKQEAEETTLGVEVEEEARQKAEAEWEEQQEMERQAEWEAEQGNYEEPPY